MDDTALPLSALQHYAVCPRQCALIHVEQLWLDNARTAEGIALHRSTEEEWAETRAGLRRVHGLALSHTGLSLYGRADVVDFQADGTPYPVEFKRGRPKRDDRDRVQLCAQALCLEDMTGRPVPEGALFYADPRRRDVVRFDAALRNRVTQLAIAAHQMIRDGQTPPPPDRDTPDCFGCSLRPACHPTRCGQRDHPVARYFRLADLESGLEDPCG